MSEPQESFGWGDVLRRLTRPRVLIALVIIGTATWLARDGLIDGTTWVTLIGGCAYWSGAA